MTNFRIALRNLNRQKKRSFLLGGAIAFGILIITLLNGFTGSFVENVGENFSHLLAGHIFIDGFEKSPTGKNLSIIRNDSEIIASLESSGISIRYLTKRSSFRGTIIFEGEDVSQNIAGVDFSEEDYLKERLILVEGSIENMEDPRGIILSEDVVEKLKLAIGDQMLAQLTTVTGQQNVGEFVLAGIGHDPGLFGSMSGYANLSHVNALLDLGPKEYMTLGIFLDEIQSIDPSAERLYEDLSQRVNLFKRAPETAEQNPMMAMMRMVEEEQWEGTRFRLYTLNDILVQVKQIVQVLNIVGLVILLIVFVIIMVGIMNTFRMVMFERIREIGTMRALGMQRKGIKRLFLLEAVLLGLGGAVSGFILAGIVMFILSRINWGLDSPLFILLKNGHMTFNIQPLQVVMNFVIIAVLTLLAAFLPARKAAKLQPADALRSFK